MRVGIRLACRTLLAQNQSPRVAPTGRWRVGVAAGSSSCSDVDKGCQQQEYHCALPLIPAEGAGS